MIPETSCARDNNINQHKANTDISKDKYGETNTNNSLMCWQCAYLPSKSDYNVLMTSIYSP